LLHHHFTGYYTCSVLILLDIALAADQFYQMLLLLYHYFTGYYICSAPILPDIALAADQFYQMEARHEYQLNGPAFPLSLQS